MAGPNDFTGQNIQDTYQRVLQVSSSGQITDGTGSLVLLDTNAVASSSFAVTASFAVSASHEITFELSSSHAQTADTASFVDSTTLDTFKTTGVRSGDGFIDGNITASGNISSSGTIIANKANIIGDVSASTVRIKKQNAEAKLELQASSQAYQSSIDFSQGGIGNLWRVGVTNSTLFKPNFVITSGSAGTLGLNNDQSFIIKGDEFKVGVGFPISPGQSTSPNLPAKFNVNGDILTSGSNGHITASGHISASGTGSFPGLEVDGYITHTGDTNTYFGFTAADTWEVFTGGGEMIQINSTGTTFNVSGNDRDFKVSGNGGNLFILNDGSNRAVFPTITEFRIGLADSTSAATLEVAGNISATGSNAHITASGNISSSGDLEISSSITFGDGTAKIIGPGNNDYMLLSTDNIDFYLNGAEAISFSPTQIIMNASNQNIDFSVAHDAPGVAAIATDASANRVRIRDFVTIGSGSVPNADPNALLVSGSSQFIGHITASGNISSSGVISGSNIVESMSTGTGNNVTLTLYDGTTFTRTINNISNAVTASNADCATEVNTQTCDANAERFITFVDNDNTTAACETVKTNPALRWNCAKRILIVDGKILTKGSDVAIESGSISMTGDLTITGSISSSGADASISVTTGSFNHVITDGDTIQFRNATTKAVEGNLTFDPTNGLSVKNSDKSDDAPLKVKKLTAGSIGSIHVTASQNISASGIITANSFVGTLTGTATGLTGTPNITVGSIEATSLNVTSITSSIVTSSILQTEGSNIFGDDEKDTQTFNGHITASGNISASGHIESERLINSTIAPKAGTFANAALKINAPVDGFHSQIEFQKGGTTQWIIGSDTTATPAVGAGSNDFRIIKANTTLNNFNGLFITASNYNVGVGTGTPNEKLTVEGNVSASGNIIANNISASGISIASASTHVHGMSFNTIVNGFEIGSQIANSFYQAQEFHQYLSGNVIVGSNSTNFGGTAKLDVDGNIATNSHITASGQISSSGTGENYFGGDVNVIDADIILDNNKSINFKHATSGTEFGNIFMNTSNQMIFQNNKTNGDVLIKAGGSGVGNVIIMEGGTTNEIAKFGETDSLELIGNFTASGDISASGDVFGANADFAGTGSFDFLRVDGDFDLNGSLVGTYGRLNFAGAGATSYITNGKFAVNDSSTTGGATFQVDGHSNLKGNVTASGNISASGYVYGDRGIFASRLQTPAWRFTDIDITSDNGPVNFNGSGGTTLTINSQTGEITASGDISSSLNGTVSAGSGSFHILKGDTTQATGLSVNGTITASGDISSSATVTANAFIGSNIGTITKEFIPIVPQDFNMDNVPSTRDYAGFIADSKGGEVSVKLQGFSVFATKMIPKGFTATGGSVYGSDTSNIIEWSSGSIITDTNFNISTDVIEATTGTGSAYSSGVVGDGLTYVTVKWTPGTGDTVFGGKIYIQPS